MILNTVSGPGRITSTDAAKELLDTATKKYAESCSLLIQAQTETPAGQSLTIAAIDPSLLAKVTQDQRDLATKQLRILSDYLQLDQDGNSDLLAELEKTQLELQNSQSFWISELGEDFPSGIKPRFDSRKGRRFNFSWNQARQDVMDAYHNIEDKNTSEESTAQEDTAFEELCLTIANRSNEKILHLVQSLLELSSWELEPRRSFVELGKRLTTLLSSTFKQAPRASFGNRMVMPQTIISNDGSIQHKEIPRTGFRGETYPELLRFGLNTGTACGFSRFHIHSHRKTSENDLTESFLNSISNALQFGTSFANKFILFTGAGPGLIGLELIQALLRGGAYVIVTTSREPAESSRLYQQIYAENCSRGSELVVLPFNQGSAQDCKDLVEYIYSDSGLTLNLDAIIPFAAMSEEGVEVENIDGKSELAHRLMLMNIIRLLSHLIRCKKELNIRNRPTQVIFPLSPNHGIFGGNGLYSETKLGLEGLLDRFHTESWSDAVTVCGKEMALNILTLLTPKIVQECEDFPVVAGFSGGLGILKAIYEEDRLEASCNSNSPEPEILMSVKLRSTLSIPFPALPDLMRDSSLKYLEGMVDLSGTVVVMGYSELGAWGSARTRWMMESQGKLSQSGFIELAWMMNLIKHFDGETVLGHYVGWVDSKTSERVHDGDVEAKYGPEILKNSGIRFIDPEAFNGYDPKKKEFLQEIAVEEDLPEFETDHTTAIGMRDKHGDNVIIRQIDGQDQYRVRIKAGAHIMVPRTFSLDSSLVAGQLPKGWDAAKYGLQEEIASQVDPVTLYTLCCVAEALFSAGITNALEIYKYIHTSEIGNFVGSSMGGTEKTRQMYRDVYLDKRVQGDIIQETYLNTPAAWVNMLLLGSNGPIKTPVGACATGIESIDIGYDSIISRKTKICIVGGADNFHEDESYRFSTIKATVNTASELQNGRTPAEMSRPTSETRAGFVESQGCGI
ncbi:fatty acid synthase alpha subunit [Phlyctema vagabunda]|uniref:Fatty acid synthase alpha subunit n=1 Tax=Phlyctema vagabunda TaxID=108571 RepID=A0ABR4PC59_9HELO